MVFLLNSRLWGAHAGKRLKFAYGPSVFTTFQEAKSRDKGEDRHWKKSSKRRGEEEQRKQVENLTMVLAFWPFLITVERAKNTKC